ncbi:hypothetical protein [Qipengyuania sp.]|uniref:hypothetical protein n=1 Tax=Qipengyuania sp. TaxID=2004515 RepID=UPI0035C7DD62
MIALIIAADAAEARQSCLLRTSGGFAALIQPHGNAARARDSRAAMARRQAGESGQPGQ